MSIYFLLIVEELYKIEKLPLLNLIIESQILFISLLFDSFLPRRHLTIKTVDELLFNRTHRVFIWSNGLIEC